MNMFDGHYGTAGLNRLLSTPIQERSAKGPSQESSATHNAALKTIEQGNYSNSEAKRTFVTITINRSRGSIHSIQTFFNKVFPFIGPAIQSSPIHFTDRSPLESAQSHKSLPNLTSHEIDLFLKKLTNNTSSNRSFNSPPLNSAGLRTNHTALQTFKKLSLSVLKIASNGFIASAGAMFACSSLKSSIEEFVNSIFPSIGPSIPGPIFKYLPPSIQDYFTFDIPKNFALPDPTVNRFLFGAGIIAIGEIVHTLALKAFQHLPFFKNHQIISTFTAYVIEFGALTASCLAATSLFQMKLLEVCSITILSRISKAVHSIFFVNVQ